jgi:hypothetical protein
MIIRAHTLADLRDKLNELATRIDPNTPVPWDVPFRHESSDECEVSVSIGVHIASSVWVIPRIEA